MASIQPGESTQDRPILVIGGAGFIGSHVVEALLAQGRAVRVLDDLSAGRPQNLPMQHEGLELIVGDILDYSSVRGAMQGVTCVLHLAGQVSPERSFEDPYGSALCNILGFINVLEAARDTGVARLVYASSVAVYGDDDDTREAAPLQPGNPYALEKVVNEQYAGLYQRRHGLRTLGLRYFPVSGERQPADSPYAAGDGFVEQVPSAPMRARPAVTSAEAAAATIAALDSDACGVCNVGGAGASPDDVAPVARRALRRPPVLVDTTHGIAGARV